MSLLDSLGLGNLIGQNQVQSNQSAFNRAQQMGQPTFQSSMAAQTASQHNQMMYGQAMMMKNRTKWMFNGIECSGPREMADIIWANDCPEKTHFLLKYE